MSKFSVVQLFTFLLFTGVFAYLMDWKMVWASGISTLFWMIIYLGYQKKHSRVLFILGGGVSIIYAFYASFRFGWESGFFFLVLSVLPLSFLNIHLKKITAVVCRINCWRWHDRVVFSFMVYPAKHNIGRSNSPLDLWDKPGVGGDITFGDRLFL